jgi:hypothetical protein
VKLVVHTKYGVFESIEQDYDDEYYEQVKELLAKLPEFKYFTFETNDGNLYLTKDMIGDSLFQIIKGDSKDEEN